MEKKKEEKKYSRKQVIKFIHDFANSEEVACIMVGYYSGCQDDAAKRFIKRIKL